MKYKKFGYYMFLSGAAAAGGFFSAASLQILNTIISLIFSLIFGSMAYQIIGDAA